ncbi:type I-E CRISPR-associated protein Cas5/CasD [Paeniglutamicibacter sp. NPDC091659]|uniref:type I-E CRISPR-associated protein Cas5/CasD n=1 Tax=Paeniglutamicibacter sp. NPDC091659 TaxID=3364389 RepID=UPI0037FF75A1
MTVSVLLALAGPLQSWGSDSRFTVRATRTEPTKSGVLGLVASALGRDRGDTLEDLGALNFAVRTEQEGTLLEDLQVSLTLDKSERMPLSRRYYLADARFTAALSGDEKLVRDIADALSHPAYPLFLGRRSCPPARPVSMRGIHDGTDGTGLLEGDAVQALRALPAQMHPALQKRLRNQETLLLPLHADTTPDDPRGITIRDLPVSFSPIHRHYLPRTFASLEPVIRDNQFHVPQIQTNPGIDDHNTWDGLD